MRSKTFRMGVQVRNSGKNKRYVILYMRDNTLLSDININVYFLTKEIGDGNTVKYEY